MKHDIYDILPQYWAGTATEAENAAVVAWMEKHPEDYQWLELAWKEGGKMPVKQFNTIKAWEKVSVETTDQTNTTAKPSASQDKVVPMRRRWLRTVAAAAALLLFGWAGWNLFGSSREVTLYAKDTQAIELNDGTVVHVNKGSTLKYPKHFSDTDRTVRLSGIAFFDVARNEHIPFIIETEEAKIKVLGTSFNVNSKGKGVQVEVKTGKVQLSQKTTTEHVVLNAGQKGVLYNGKLKTVAITDENHLGWKTGRFDFTNEPFFSAIRQLNSYYDDKFRVEKGLKPDCLVTAQLNTAPIEQVLENITTFCEVKIEAIDDFYVIKKK